MWLHSLSTPPGRVLPLPQFFPASFPPSLLTIGCAVSSAAGQVGTEDGIVEGIEVGGHAVVSLVVVVHLGRQRREGSIGPGCSPVDRGLEEGSGHRGGNGPWQLGQELPFKPIRLVLPTIDWQSYN